MWFVVRGGLGKIEYDYVGNACAEGNNKKVISAFHRFCFFPPPSREQRMRGFHQLPAADFRCSGSPHYPAIGQQLILFGGCCSHHPPPSSVPSPCAAYINPGGSYLRSDISDRNQRAHASWSRGCDDASRKHMRLVQRPPRMKRILLSSVCSKKNMR